jgi:light-regulated signal transduction histidine kinase (bacteriophytochrome)/CheY-like chemotaxis protein
MDNVVGPFDTLYEEAIRAPGAIQAWGALLIADGTDLIVSHASANLAAVLGTEPADAIGRPLAAVIGAATIADLIAGAGGETARADAVPFRPHRAGLPALSASAHRLASRFYVELEPARGQHDRAARLHVPGMIRSLRGAGSKPELFAIAIAELRRTTGFDRVHVYRFDPDGHGEVIAESCAPDLAPLLGLHFPATYIPTAAREILSSMTVRVVADVDAARVPLVGGAAGEASPDLSLCALRMTADCCTGFFRKMGLRSAISIGLTVNGGLWGILSCHHRAPARMSPAARGLCEVIGQVSSLMVSRLREAGGRAAAASRQAFFASLANRLAASQDDPAALATSLANEGKRLLAVCDAAGAIIRLGGQTMGVGMVPDGAAGGALLDSLLSRVPPHGAPCAWDKLGSVLDSGELRRVGDIAGTLILPLHYADGDAIAWLRPAQIATVQWGSAPYGAPLAETFTVWQQEVRDRSVPWQPAQFAAAEDLRRELDRLMAGYAASMRAAREAAERAAQAKTMFLATMSHEIRSPMSGLLGVLDLLRNSNLDPEQSRMAGMIHQSGSMLLSVLNDILDFSKIEAGALTISPTPIALRSVIGGLADPLAVTAAEKGIPLRVIIDKDVPDAISTDPLRLRQILNNLLSNATKFSASGEITLRVDRAGDMLRFRVRDAGIGMSAEVIGRLFTPFMQADGSTTRSYGGTGLGLSISRELVRLLGGELTVTSEVGVGSEFAFEIPLTPAVLNAATVEPVVPVAVPNGKRVLIVEDDATIRWLSQRQLERLGLLVDVAADGEAGLHKLREGGFDLLLTDCHMPAMDGVALTQVIRAESNPALKALPIIGLTADVTEAQRTRCVAAGMNELVIKPLTLERLSLVLQKYLAKHDAQQPLRPEPVLQSVAFDEQIFSSIFPAGDPAGAGWLTEWIASSRQDLAELGALVAGVAHDPAARSALRKLAHRSAGAAFSVGAMLLGEALRKLERAAIDRADLPTLQTLYDTANHELDASAAAIEAFIAIGETNSPGS